MDVNPLASARLATATFLHLSKQCIASGPLRLIFERDDTKLVPFERCCFRCDKNRALDGGRRRWPLVGSEEPVGAEQVELVESKVSCELFTQEVRVPRIHPA